ncbi:MAG: diguanylate cyclase [Gammaproteobacteria bacterium]|nr:diguanylate cyclase [Gammaproteobacteria bacterium]
MGGFSDELTADTLTELRFFEGESPDALEWLLDGCAPVTLREGEVLLEPSQQNDTLFVLLSGDMEVRLARDGEVVSTLSKGECAGERSILGRAHTPTWVVPVTDCELMALDMEHLWMLITCSHCVSVNLLCILSERMRDGNVMIDRSLQLKSFYEHHAKVDTLTGLHNRRWLNAMLKRMTERSVVNGQPLSIIMTDIDHFKRYNDTHGKLAGDCALRMVANVIRSSLRPNDIAARFGGEEIAVILPNTGLRKALDVAQRLCEAVDDAPVYDDNGAILPPVTISAGVASVPDDSDASAVLAEADEALHRAKHQGRDRASS